MIEIDGARLMADLRRLATFGDVGRGGSRLSYSAADCEAREWLLERFQAAGLDASIDGIGNVYGQMSDRPRAVLIGSHTDTVPEGGWLDGAMGVIYGLEIARAFSEANVSSSIGVDVISFEDEEGTYLGLTGSRSFCGELTQSEIDSAQSLAGESMRDALRAAGYHGRPRARLHPDRHIAYLEGHIEQGPRLEAEHKRIGAVSGIVGMRRSRVTFRGEANHAGTTPMAMRRDAGAALVRFAHDLLTRFARHGGPDTVWNLGYMGLQPGAANIVPERAEVMVEYRDLAGALLDVLEAELGAAATAAAAQGGVAVDVSPVLRVSPLEMDPQLLAAIEQAAHAHGASPLRMPSGAGHDAMVVGRHLPVGMMFVPSIRGRSHVPDEDTVEKDVILGARVLASAVESLAGRYAD